VQDGDGLVFVEVKQRKAAILTALQGV